MHRTLFTSCLNELHSASQTTVVSPLSCRVIRSISGCSKVNKHAPLFVADETDRFNRYKLEIWETWPRVTAYSTVACAYCYNIFATKTSNSQLRCSHVERLMFASTSKLHAALPWLTKSMVANSFRNVVMSCIRNSTADTIKRGTTYVYIFVSQNVSVKMQNMSWIFARYI